MIPVTRKLDTSPIVVPSRWTLSGHSVKLIWFLSLIIIVAGFIFCSWGITKEHFEYRTTTRIAIQDYAEVGVKAPGLVTCIKYWRPVGAKVSSFLTGEEDYLNDKNDTWRVIKMLARVTPGEEQQVISKKFLLEDRYCLFVQPKNLFRMDVVRPSRPGQITSFYTVIISMSPIHGTNTFGYANRKCSPKFVNIYTVDDESSLTNPSNRLYGTVACARGFPRYNTLVTYSSFVNNRLPAPFDTNCLDYPKETNSLSSSHCYDECLKEKTREMNVIPDMTIIHRDRYNRSDAYFAQRDIIEDKEKLYQFLSNTYLPKQLRQMHVMGFNDFPYSNKSFTDKIRETFVALHSSWKGIKKACRSSCYRPDCRSEDISTHITQIAGFASAVPNDTEPLQSFRIVFMTAAQPTLEVFTTPKQGLLDFIIYLSSMFSFWLGFCPLTMMETIIERLKRTARKIKTAKTLEEMVDNQDDMIRRMARELATVKEQLERLPGGSGGGGNSLYTYESWAKNSTSRY